MKSNFHGVASLTLVVASVLMALLYMLSLSPVWGLVYLGIVVITNPIVLYAYCAKCLCRDDACGHLVPGKLTRLLPARKQGPYGFRDYFGTALPLAALFGFPIPWLWQSKVLFFVYWLLLLVGLAEILFLVCRSCRNWNCPNCSMPPENM